LTSSVNTLGGVESESIYDNHTLYKFTSETDILPELLVVIVPLISKIVKSERYCCPPGRAMRVPVYSIVIPTDSSVALALFPLSITLPSNSATSLVPKLIPTLKVERSFANTTWVPDHVSTNPGPVAPLGENETRTVSPDGTLQSSTRGVKLIVK